METAQRMVEEAARLALFDDQDKSEQIIDALIKIANGEEEVTLSNIRNDLEDYGGTNDITLIYGNEKKVSTISHTDVA